MSVQIGDRVQIKAGAVDVTNGKSAVAGKSYGEGGPLWCTVEAIIDNWETGSKWGLPSSVTKVRCSNNGIVVWQVQPKDISRKITVPELQPIPVYKPILHDKIPLHDDELFGKKFILNNNTESNTLYAPAGNAQVWTEDDGIEIKQNNSSKLPSTTKISTQVVTGRNVFDTNEQIIHTSSGGFRDLTTEERKIIGPGSIKVDEGVLTGASIKTAFQNPEKKRQILNDDTENIINQYGFPYLSKGSEDLISAKYDYQIIPSDQRYSKMITLEDKLKTARATFGIPVHGSNAIARAMKYYMYNRFKVPDQNLAHNKTFTYVFFTRPDLNLLDYTTQKANEQTMNHTEAAMVWKRYPELFKLLTDKKRCKDSNNFNMLLSNQVRSFSIQDEQITTVKAGKSWHEYEMQYGDSYSGGGAGEFTCTFDEVADYSVINNIKLWITYIDMVSKGAWSPSYNLFNQTGDKTLGFSHIFTKTLDYASSAYVFKCGPDGEDVLYWTKYFGVFPINTGANALDWDHSTPVGDSPKLNIRFAYSFKRDMNPISLIEFNHVAGVPDLGGSISYEDAYNPNYGHTSRPFVGAPFIAMKLGGINLSENSVNYKQHRTEIRLKFQKYDKLSDELLYKS